jgi:hypothetical protein
LQRNKIEVEKNTKRISPRIKKDLNEKKEIIKKHKREIMVENAIVTKVKSKSSKDMWHLVNCKNYVCSCGEQEITRKPCQHAI